MIVNLNEARDEARRLTKVLKRDVEVKSVECCEFDRSCSCGGAGLSYRLVFSFCQHDAEVDPQTACESEDCVHQGYLASVEREEMLETVSR